MYSVSSLSCLQAKSMLNAVNALPQLEQAVKLIARVPQTAKWAADLHKIASKLSSLLWCMYERHQKRLTVQENQTYSLHGSKQLDASIEGLTCCGTAGINGHWQHCVALRGASAAFDIHCYTDGACLHLEARPYRPKPFSFVNSTGQAVRINLPWSAASASHCWTQRDQIRQTHQENRKTSLTRHLIMRPGPHTTSMA